jgi:peptidoglycan DL-endopeptidase CwlO
VLSAGQPATSCARDVGSECGGGVSGWGWRWVILRGMSLDGLVAEVGQLLGQARELYGPAPRAGPWGSTGVLSAGREGVAQAGGVLQSWGGAGATSQFAASGGRVLALDNTIGADQSTGSGFGDAADASRSGRAGMDTVVNDTDRGVAAVAPSTGTAAGKRQLVDHLQSQLDRAKGLLKVSEQRNIMLANLIRSGAAGYSATPRMGGMSAGIPMTGTPMTGGISGGTPTGVVGSLIPNLTALNHLTNTHRRRSDFGRFAPAAVGSNPLAQMAVKAALSKQGTPYVWGARGPDAFDCSGLTRWAWAQAGVTLGPDTYTQIKQGAPVAPGDVQAGDLIFPSDAAGGHVQLAVSPTQVVHAPQPGDVVRVAPMPSSFTARRPAAG